MPVHLRRAMILLLLFGVTLLVGCVGSVSYETVTQHIRIQADMSGYIEYEFTLNPSVYNSMSLVNSNPLEALAETTIERLGWTGYSYDLTIVEENPTYLIRIGLGFTDGQDMAIKLSQAGEQIGRVQRQDQLFTQRYVFLANSILVSLPTNSFDSVLTLPGTLVDTNGTVQSDGSIRWSLLQTPQRYAISSSLTPFDAFYVVEVGPGGAGTITLGAVAEEAAFERAAQHLGGSGDVQATLGEWIRTSANLPEGRIGGKVEAPYRWVTVEQSFSDLEEFRFLASNFAVLSYLNIEAQPGLGGNSYSVQADIPNLELGLGQPENVTLYVRLPGAVEPGGNVAVLEDGTLVWRVSSVQPVGGSATSSASPLRVIAGGGGLALGALLLLGAGGTLAVTLMRGRKAAPPGPDGQPADTQREKSASISDADLPTLVADVTGKHSEGDEHDD